MVWHMAALLIVAPSSAIKLPRTKMSALFSLQGLITVILLFICTCTYIRMKFPTIFDRNQQPGKHEGLSGLCWKASRIGERKSQYVAGVLVVMAVHTLFLA